jgi:methylenetetrahydrofolate dehydrogenase (NADP+)/methenyltetrahydrofolate cyclohydrolase
MTTLLLAKPVVEASLKILQSATTEFQNKNIIPYMKVILVGEHKPSVIYTRNKKKFMEKFGAKCDIVNLPENINEEEFRNTVLEMANNKLVHGLFVQLPLPNHLSKVDIPKLIPAEKDVDGFHGDNIFKLFSGDIGDNSLLPCTPKGIVSLLKFYNIELSGKNVVIIGRSHIVGKPLSLLLTNHDATVTLCHSKSKNTKELCQNADIIISAVGKPRYLDITYLSENNNQVLIDVGINHDSDGKLCGDLNFDEVKDHVEAITPVPGSIGPMTILSLAQNLLQATRNHQ